MHAVITPIGADLYAVPVDWVRQVVAAPVVARLVTAPPSVLGVFNLRGEIVPLLDTGVLLGVGAVSVATHVIVLGTPHGPAGLAASAMPSRAELPEPSASAELRGATHTYEIDGEVVVGIDPGVLLAPERLTGRDAPTPGEAASWG